MAKVEANSPAKTARRLRLEALAADYQAKRAALAELDPGTMEAEPGSLSFTGDPLRDAAVAELKHAAQLYSEALGTFAVRQGDSTADEALDATPADPDEPDATSRWYPLRRQLVEMFAAQGVELPKALIDRVIKACRNYRTGGV